MHNWLPKSLPSFANRCCFGQSCRVGDRLDIFCPNVIQKWSEGVSSSSSLYYIEIVTLNWAYLRFRLLYFRASERRVLLSECIRPACVWQMASCEQRRPLGGSTGASDLGPHVNGASHLLVPVYVYGIVSTECISILYVRYVWIGGNSFRD